MNYNDINAALTLMRQGMLGVFTVMALIALTVFLVTKLSK